MEANRKGAAACVGRFDPFGDRYEQCHSCPKLKRHLQIFCGASVPNEYASPYKCEHFKSYKSNFKKKQTLKN